MGKASLRSLQLAASSALVCLTASAATVTALNSPVATCSGGICFMSPAAKAAYEKANNCTFSGCPNLNAQTQCCVTDSTTGKQTPVAKQITSAPQTFNWANYVNECTNMHQSEAKPDALWQSCTVGKKQSPSDDYTIIQVKQNPNDPNARPYCIDGCSTPPPVVRALYLAGTFLVADRNDPSGVPSASFLPACSNHDICYQTCSASLNESTCDQQLLNQSDAACQTIPANQTGKNAYGFTVNVRNSCLSAASTMYKGLQEFGSKAFNMRREQMCQCC
jgi:hypothetical protein